MYLFIEIVLVIVVVLIVIELGKELIMEYKYVIDEAVINMVLVGVIIVLLIAYMAKRSFDLYVWVAKLWRKK